MARLTLCVLGALRVTLDGQPIRTFASAKTRALLVYLALESNRPHTRDALAGLFWPEESNQTARDNLRQTLAILRKAIGERADSPSPWLDVTRNTIQFNAGSDQSVDAVSFTRLLDACAAHRHRHSETCRECAENRRQALELYGGDFLDQFYLHDSAPFEEWALVEREKLRELALDALGQLAEFHTRRAAYKQAHSFALRQLELDPWREEGHRQAMRALALDGRISGALAQYEYCRRVLADEMAVEPAEETTALYEAIKRQAAGALEERQLSALLLRPSAGSLPFPATPLLGRAAELKELDHLLSDPSCRLISIVGPGGAGKTRLAIAAAAEQRGEFDHGIFFIALSSLNSPRLLAPTLLAAMGAPLQGQQDPAEQLIAYLRERQVLLVLDSLEHLVEGAPLLAELVRRAPRVTLLVTSRERLNLQGEWVLDLQGLEVPPGERGEDVERYSAVQLFIQSAQRGGAVRSFSDEDKSVIVRICQQVEGMPLAIELAAAWVRTLSCREIADEIEKSFGFLSTTLRDVPPRHRSMRAIFEHSWSLLNAEERGALRQLSVFQGGFQRDAADQVAHASLPLLAALMDKSLVRLHPAERYGMHDLVRQFAHEQLMTAGEIENTRSRHAAYYVALAEAAAPRLDGPEQAEWLQRLEMDNANLRAALAWLVEGGTERAEASLRLSGSLGKFWHIRGYAAEGRRWLESALEQAAARTRAGRATPSAETDVPSLTPAVQIKALRAAGNLADLQCDYNAAQSLHQQALKLCQETGDTAGIASSFINLGSVANHLGEYAEAHALFEQALALFRQLGDKARIARTLLNMGHLADEMGDHASARTLYKECLALRRDLGDQFGIALVLGNLGGMATKEGDFARAHALLEESLSLRRGIGDELGIAFCLIELAKLARAEHDDAQARGLYRQGLVLRRKLGDAEGVAACLESLAEAEVSLGQVERGVLLWGAAEAIRQALGAPLSPAQRSHYEEIVTRVQAEWGEKAFARTWAEGQSMTTEEAIACALGE